MKRVIFGGIITVALVLLGASCAIAAHSNTRDTNNFTITNYDVQLELGRDRNNHSTLKTIETITADFPPDQNHGITRQFVKKYDGHATDFALESVKDEHGVDLEYYQNGNTLRVGNKNAYVSGTKTYVITYTQRDVTRYYSDTQKDEFYWNAIGVDSPVPVASAVVTLKLDAALAGKAKTNIQCYYGALQAKNTCESTASGTEYSLHANNLGRYQGVTIALGFEPGMFAAYQPSLRERLPNIILTGAAAMFGMGIVVLVFCSRKWKKKFAEELAQAAAIRRQPVAPEYVPPADRSVVESIAVLGWHNFGKALSAQVVDWAVRHIIEIRQTGTGKHDYMLVTKKSFIGTSKYEQTLAAVIFGNDPAVGTERTFTQIKQKSYSVSSRFLSSRRQIKRGELFLYNRKEISLYTTWLVTSLTSITAIFFIILWLLGDDAEGGNVSFLAAAACAGFATLNIAIAAIMSRCAQNRLSAQGEELKRYLRGLKLYINAAEADQLRMLQSPEGADKVGDVASDNGALVRLYERCLPYAIIFGCEREWNKRLGQLYEELNESPDWITADDVSLGVNIAILSQLTSDFSEIGVSSMVSNVSSSSTFGGSSGGGFSGGGGGGGGVGGW